MPACDVVNLNEIRPGVTTAAEVKARMGEPGFIHHDNDGTAIWEYSRQPQGVHCYMIAFDRKEVVTRMDQVLNDANYARIADGLSKDDVRRILGAPATKVVFDNLREEIMGVTSKACRRRKKLTSWCISTPATAPSRRPPPRGDEG